MKAIVKKPSYPFHPWLITLAGKEIIVERNKDGYLRQVREDGEPGFVFSNEELVIVDDSI